MSIEVAEVATAIGVVLGGVVTAIVKLRRDSRQAKEQERTGEREERDAAAAPWRNLYHGCEASRKALQAKVDAQGVTITDLTHRLGVIEGVLSALNVPHPLGRRQYDSVHVTPQGSADDQ